MKRFSPAPSFLIGFLLLVFSVSLVAQTDDPYAAAQEPDSTLQAYKALQQKPNPTPDAEVALDANVIIDLLQKQPALALEIKKELVQTAFDQGRLLEEDDLTDSVLYDLIRKDLKIRELATDQIVKRHYLELKPTDQEILEARLERRQIERLESEQEKKADQKQHEEDERNGILPQNPQERVGDVQANAN